MTDVWWLTASTPGGAWSWPLDDDPQVRDGQVHAVRVLLGFPAHNDWVLDSASPWQLRVAPYAPDSPVSELGGLVRDLAELEAVDAAEIEAHRRECADAVQAADVATVRELLAALPAEHQAALHAELSAPEVSRG